MNYKEIGKYIKAKREDKRISIDELSNKLDVPIKRIKSWEKGRRIPDPNKMKDLCKTLGIKLNELLFAKDLAAKEKISEDDVIDIIKENNIIEKSLRITLSVVLTLLLIRQIINIWMLGVDKSIETIDFAVLCLASATALIGSFTYNKRTYKKKNK